MCCSLDTLPELTEAQEANLRALAARPESGIDTSDIPPVNEAQRAGQRYQSRINAILLREMLAASRLD